MAKFIFNPFSHVHNIFTQDYEFSLIPWSGLWGEMKDQVYSLQRMSFASEEGCQFKEEAGSLAEWMKKKETETKLRKASSSWLELAFCGGEATALAYKLLHYYRDFWKLVRFAGGSIDAAYRCIDFIREFPERVSWDLDEAKRKCLSSGGKDGDRRIAYRSLTEWSYYIQAKYQINQSHNTSLDEESRLVVA